MSNAIKYAEAVKFYKKRAELQVKIAKPEADEGGRITKKGAIFFEMANALSGGDPKNPRMDWANKIIMKIGTNDIAQILHGLRTRSPEIKLFHSNATGSSTCSIKPGNEGSYGVSIFKKDGEESKNASLFLSGPDMVVLSTLLAAALPVTLGWS
jgi:hypothetical protein